MDTALLRQTHSALLLATGALVALVESGRAKETDKVTFTGAFADLGSVTIKDALDAADHAIGLGNSALSGTAEDL